MARSVLKRTERIRQMHEKGKWKRGISFTVYRRSKTLRIKIKKEKVARLSPLLKLERQQPPEQHQGQKMQKQHPRPKRRSETHQTSVIYFFC